MPLPYQQPPFPSTNTVVADPEMKLHDSSWMHVLVGHIMTATPLAAVSVMDPLPAADSRKHR